MIKLEVESGESFFEAFSLFINTFFQNFLHSFLWQGMRVFLTMVLRMRGKKESGKGLYGDMILPNAYCEKKEIRGWIYKDKGA